MALRIGFFLRLVAGALALSLGAAPALAQASAEETVAYQKWHAASTSQDAAAARLSAQEYLNAFPQGQYADYLKKWIAAEQGKALNAAIQAKNTSEMIALGRELLAASPDNLNILYTLAFNIRKNELLASPPVYKHAAEAADFATRALRLIEAGQALAGVDPSKWEPKTAQAWLQQVLAVTSLQAGRGDEALELYAKSSALAPADAAINLHNSFGCGALRKERYDAAVKAFQALPKPEAGAEPSAEMKAALDRANGEADAAIDCWARFAGLARARGVGAAARQQVEAVLANLYAYRHPDDAAGLEQLIGRHEQEAKTPPSSR